MRTFQIYKHPTLGSEAVKVGFNWPAFFFGPIWMLVCKLWGKAGLWLVLYLVASIVEDATDRATNEGLQAIVYFLLTAGYFALWLIPGFHGNAWRVANLQSRGYELSNKLQAETKDAAVAQAFRSTVT